MRAAMVTMSNEPRRVTDNELRDMVSALNHLAQRHQGLELAQKVGETYVEWADRGLRVSLRRLGQHPYAILRRSRLTNYVGVYRQSAQLQPGWERLPLSAHTELLRVSDIELKHELANRYTEQGWGIEELQHEVARVLDDSDRRRRMKGLAADLESVAGSLVGDPEVETIEGLGEADSLCGESVPAPGALSLRVAKAWRDEAGFIWFRFLETGEHTFADAQEIVAAHIELANGRPTPVISDLRFTRTGADKDARAYYVGPEGARDKSAMAMIVHSPVQRMLGNIFLRFNRPPYPTKLVRGPAEAVSWARDYLS